MNSNLDALQSYPFEKLRALLAGIAPPTGIKPVLLSLGEPAHAAPTEVLEVLASHLGGVSHYPATRGIPELREAIATWARHRYKLPDLDSDSQVLPVNGTREAIFSLTQAVVQAGPEALVLSPNPFYQIYEGAALLAGAQPLFLDCLPEQKYQPDLDAVTPEQWRACQLFYLCSPGNPTGAVARGDYLARLLDLADEYDFVVASDECYSELYPDENYPPPGLLQVCAETGRADFHRCIVFHSLSKRSNLPGLRSGFVAGDARILAQYLRYRTYHGCAMPLHHQHASIAAWSDEAHVVANRAQYLAKFDAVLDILAPVMDVQRPEAGFYLWPKLDVPGEVFCQGLYREQAVTVLPGAYIGRVGSAGNPGEHRVRMALVATLEDCIAAAERIRHYIEGQN